MTLSEIYYTIYPDHVDTPDTKVVIDTYEKYKDLIDSANIDGDPEIYRYVTHLISDYALRLIERESYTKSIPFLNRAIALWENKPTEIFTSVSDMNWYKALRFERGRAYLFRKKQKAAMNDFEWLVKHYPENERYKKGLVASKNQKLSFVEDFLFKASLLMFIVTFLIPKAYVIKLVLGALTPILIFTSLIIGVIRKMRIKNAR